MRKCVVVLAAVMLVSSASAALTPTFDGLLDEWVGPDVTNLGSQPGPDAGTYTLLSTWDADNLYFGMDRDTTDRYLGDTYWDNDTFFVALDIDGVPGSGGVIDGYQRMNFAGTMLPDIVYCYAGGGGWWEKAIWNGAEWDWPGWSNAGTYYGWGDTNPNDELAIPLVDIGRSADIEVWAWMTRERGSDPLPIEVHASWPAGATGSGDPVQPTMYDGIMVPTPEPASLLGMALLGLLIRRR